MICVSCRRIKVDSSILSFFFLGHLASVSPVPPLQKSTTLVFVEPATVTSDVWGRGLADCNKEFLISSPGIFSNRPDTSTRIRMNETYVISY